MLCFIDETGDHNLQIIDKEYPLFGLGVLCISEEEYAQISESINSLKREYFDAIDFILHSSELKRPFHKRSDERNQIMHNTSVRREFYDSFDEKIIKKLPQGIIGCFIYKERFAQQYHYPADPYHLSFENILNRVLWALPENDVAKITVECRSKELDDALMAEYDRLCKVGARFHSAEEVRSKTSLSCVAKEDNINGLQVIDMILASLARHYLGKTEKMKGNDLSPFLCEEKYFKNPRNPTFFPK